MSSDGRTRVLLAEPDKISLTHMEQLLLKTGYAVVTTSDGHDALAILTAQDSPKLAVLGSILPGVGGLEICRRLRQNGGPRNAYIVLLTTWGGVNDRASALEGGADDILYKPVDVRELGLRLEIGSRILAEQELKAAHAETEHFVELIPSILIGLDGDGVITRWNLSAKTTFGIDSAHAIGRPIVDCGIHWRNSQMSEEVARWMKADDCRIDAVGFELDGKPRVLGLHIQRMSPRHGKRLGFIITGADVTERKQVEEQLSQSQKLKAIGQLAAGIAHEINTPTQYVGDNLRFLRDSWTAMAPIVELCRTIRQQAGQQAGVAAELLTAFDSLAEQTDIDYQMSEIPHAIEQSLDGLERVATIVRAVKEFSHPGSEERRGIDINKALESTTIVAKNEWKYVADLDLRLATGLPPISCLAGELNQVFLNLIVNAAHAVAAAVKDSTRKGKITITSRREDDWAEISVRDTGCGIPKEIVSRVFEPFFTTKPIGQGTGQGLALAHAVIVTRHRGKIWFESVPGEGTTFFIRLPLEPGGSND